MTGERTVAIIQARMGSERFPGKTLARLGDLTLLEWVIRRVKDATSVADVVLATSDQERDDQLEPVARNLGIDVYRGSEHDVLGRFCAAADLFSAKHVVRVCADNPFVAPEEIDRLVSFYEGSGVDYAFNHIPARGNRYPDGLGAEICATSVLHGINDSAFEPQHHEHPTILIWEGSTEYTIAGPQAPDEIAYPWIKLDIDTPGDLEALRTLDCVHTPAASAEEVVASYLRARGSEV